ncbi:MAG: hypothetical protein LBB08_00200 [Rickettsiales bacterium]|nr:hypothetical protein [Rickettsiales bacterium]
MKKFALILAAVALPCFGDRYLITDMEENITYPVHRESMGGIQPIFRADIQSTSTDWEAVSGLRLHEYKMTFSNAKPAAGGWELYYLDSFPCYGYAQYVRTWVSNASFRDASLRANCVKAPQEAKLAYRAAKKNDWQGRTDGILRCPVEKNLEIDLSSCEKQTWPEFSKDEQ